MAVNSLSAVTKALVTKQDHFVFCFVLFLFLFCFLFCSFFLGGGGEEASIDMKASFIF